MIRNEELYDAAEKFSDDYKYSGDVDYMSIKIAFIEGAEWADQRPNINSLWHTPDEIPQYNKRLVIHCNEKTEWNPIDTMVYYESSVYTWDKLIEVYNILHWAYATDLVPNFNEKL